MANRLARTLTRLTPQRRWAQFNLKSLLSTVLVACVACFGVVVKRERRMRERAAVAELREVSFSFKYDWQRAGQKEPRGPHWLRKLLGDDQ